VIRCLGHGAFLDSGRARTFDIHLYCLLLCLFCIFYILTE
jgi:hypothetical protein